MNPQTLRFSPRVASSVYLNLQLDGTLEFATKNSPQSVGTKKMQLPSAGFVIFTALQRQGKQLARLARIESVDVVESSTADGRTAAKALRSLEGLSCWWLLSNQGDVQGFNCAKSSHVVDSFSAAVVMRMVLEDYFVAVPESPIGTGAIVTEQSSGTLNTIAWNRKNTYQVRAITDVLVLSGGFQTTAVPGPLTVSPRYDLELIRGARSGGVEETASFTSAQLAGTGYHRFEAGFAAHSGRWTKIMALSYEGTSRLRVMRPTFRRRSRLAR
ncbi:hypothetical protein BH11MYX2_BH11MYX2_01280 [soil metagenome]